MPRAHTVENLMSLEIGDIFYNFVVLGVNTKRILDQTKVEFIYEIDQCILCGYEETKQYGEIDLDIASEHRIYYYRDQSSSKPKKLEDTDYVFLTKEDAEKFKLELERNII